MGCPKCGGLRLNRQGRCKDCRAAYMREYMRAWKIEDPQGHREYARRRTLNAKQSGASARRRRAWNARHVEQHKMEVYAWRASRPGHHAATVRAWNQSHRERYLASAANRKSVRLARKRASEGKITTKEWAEIKNMQRGLCFDCGQLAEPRLTMGHIAPLSRGGSNWSRNIIGQCRSCNSKQHDKYHWLFMTAHCTGERSANLPALVA